MYTKSGVYLQSTCWGASWRDAATLQHSRDEMESPGRTVHTQGIHSGTLQSKEAEWFKCEVKTKVRRADALNGRAQFARKLFPHSDHSAWLQGEHCGAFIYLNNG